MFWNELLTYEFLLHLDLGYVGKIHIFLYVTPSQLGNCYIRFEGAQCLHNQG